MDQTTGKAQSGGVQDGLSRLSYQAPGENIAPPVSTEVYTVYFADSDLGLLSLESAYAFAGSAGLRAYVDLETFYGDGEVTGAYVVGVGYEVADGLFVDAGAGRGFSSRGNVDDTLLQLALTYEVGQPSDPAPQVTRAYNLTGTDLIFLID